MGIFGPSAKELALQALSGTPAIGMMGNNRYVAYTDDEVVVATVGISSGSFFGKKVKRYPIDQISAIDVRRSLLIVEFEIVMAGAREVQSFASFMSRASNENLTAFPRTQFEAVQRFASDILQVKRRRSRPTPALAAGSHIADDIRRLAELRDAGLLTDTEFSVKKAELLKRL